MAEFRKLFKKTAAGKEPEKGPSIPEGLWMKCPKCGELVYKEDVVENSYVCPKCGGYFRIGARTRIRSVADAGSFQEWFSHLSNPQELFFPGYKEKLEKLQEKTHLTDALVIGKARIGEIPVVLGAMDPRFFMASMGYLVGEKITRAFERAVEERLPVILFVCSGGARMQEGIHSLMQMAKTSAAVQLHKKAGLLYIPVLTDPTTGGVTASFAMLGDLILAEPGALIGFAGPRVIQQTIGTKLPEGFQKAEFLVEHGFVDGIVNRGQMRNTLEFLLRLHKERLPYDAFPEERTFRTIETFGKKKHKGKKEPSSAWDRVKIARSTSRPTSLEYIYGIFDQFMELHGDRVSGDDGAVVGGLALLDGQSVTVVGIQKGRTTKEQMSRNFGMPSPQGYRKALRLMKQAEKFHRPVFAFVDTPGAFCGLEAEEQGQGEAIARNLMELSDLTVPILSIVIGEGGSGGALALGVGNEVWMMENATYSILSPEGFASILWKDGKKASRAAELMKMTAADLKELEVIERVIPEETPASEENLDELCEYMKIRMKEFLRSQAGKDETQIAMERQKRFRNM